MLLISKRVDQPLERAIGFLRFLTLIPIRQCTTNCKSAPPHFRALTGGCAVHRAPINDASIRQFVHRQAARGLM